MSYLSSSDQSSKHTPGEAVFEYTETIESGKTGDAIMAPDYAGKLRDWVVGIIPSGTARIEYTLSTRSQVDAGAAVWRAWDAGDVTVNTDDLLGPVQAVRGVSVSGDVTIEVVAV